MSYTGFYVSDAFRFPYHRGSHTQRNRLVAVEERNKQQAPEQNHDV